MLEVRDELADGIDDLGFGEVVMGEDVLQLRKEGIDLTHGMASCLLHNSQGLEALHVYLLTGHVELFVGLLTGGIGREIYRWVLDG